ncbi:MAG TPA: hypothetical protein VLV32_09150, partial [Burkholderiales bacterium]|nr:hypothetical protein [Burkholderiales bacterium]
MTDKPKKPAKIDTPTGRSRLTPRREPYWHKLQKGGYLGYRRTDEGGTWIARWRNEEGKERYRALNLLPTEPAKEFDDAQQAARAWFKEQQAGIVGRWTVKQAADAYIETLRLKNGESAARDAEGRINRCITPKLGKRPLDRLTTGEIEGWRNSLVPRSEDAEQTRKSKDSVNRNLTTLKALLNKAWKSGRVMSNDPWKKVEAFEDTRNARKVFLAPEQRKRLLQHCVGAFRDLVEAALLTGARYGELRSLLAGDYDKSRRILSIRDGKTGPREVPVSDAAAVLLARLKARKLPTAFLLTRDDGKPWEHSDQDELMR